LKTLRRPFEENDERDDIDDIGDLTST